MNNKESGAHEWVIEFEALPDSMEQFIHELDMTLKSLNSDYEAKRYQNMILKEPIVHAVSKDTFYYWFKSKNKLGGQHKIPRLSNDRKYVEEILKMAGMTKAATPSDQFVNQQFSPDPPAV